MNALTRIPFAGGELLAVRGATPRETLVAMKPIAERLGLDWRSQLRRLSAHVALGACVVGLTMQIGGQAREVSALPLSRLPLWLATISTGRIPDPAVRALVVRYQVEAADALYDHFFGGQPAAPVPAPAAAGLSAATVGGVARGVINKALAEHMAPVRAGISEQQAAIAALAAKVDRLAGAVAGRAPAPATEPVPVFNSALVFLIEAGWPQKGRRGMVTAVSNQLTWFCAEHGHQTRVTAERGIRLFDVAAIAAWRRAGGDAVIAERRAQISGGSGRAAVGA